MEYYHTSEKECEYYKINYEITNQGIKETPYCVLNYFNCNNCSISDNNEIWTIQKQRNKQY